MVALHIITTSLPNVAKLVVLAAAEALAQAHQHQKRTHAPGNPEHGQEAAQLVGHDGAEDLAERVANDCISVRRREWALRE